MVPPITEDSAMFPGQALETHLRSVCLPDPASLPNTVLTVPDVTLSLKERIFATTFGQLIKVAKH